MAIIKSFNKTSATVSGNENEKRGYHTRKRIIIISAAILCVMLLYFITRANAIAQYKQYSEHMRYSITAAQSEFSDNVKKDELYYESNKSIMEDVVGFAAFCLEENGGYTEENMKILEGSIGRVIEIYYFKGTIDEKTESVKGKIIENEAYSPFYEHNGIDDKILYKVLKDGKYHNGEVNIYARPVGNDGYIIIPWRLLPLLMEQSFLSSMKFGYDEQMLRFSAASGEIEDASNPEYIGANIRDYFDEEFIRNCDSNTVYLKDKNYICVGEEQNEHVIMAYISDRAFMVELVRSVMLPVVLGWVFIFITMLYSIRFIKHTKPEGVDNEFIRLPGDWYVNRKLVSHISGMLVFAVMLIIGSSLYVNALISYGKQNILSDANLESVDNLIEINDENVKVMQKDYLDIHQIVLDAIAQYYMEFPQQLSEESLTRLRDYMPNINSITFFNQNGTSEYDTGDKISSSISGIKGYTLSRDEDANEFPCWSVLAGQKEVTNYCENGYTHYYSVGRRQDKGGIIRIESDASILEDFEKLTDMVKVVAQAYFGKSLKIYVDKNSPSVLNIFDPIGSEAMEAKNDLPDYVMENGYSGMNRLQGVNYYINTHITDDEEYTLMSAIDRLSLNGIRRYTVLLTVIIIFLIHGTCIILIGGQRLSFVPVKTYSLRERVFIRETVEEQVMDRRFIKVIRQMVITTCIAIVCLLVLDALNDRASLLSYLFKNHWSKGLNLFSFTMIIFLFAAVIIAWTIVKSMVLFITKNMGARGVTIGRMIISFLRFIVLIILVIAVIAELGVDLGPLLTSAGILGAVITFSAQQTVNDFLMGFFIVFEGLFNVGDWITVNGFRGQVIEIGIRATQIAIGDNVQIVNNSELKSVTLMAQNRAGALCVIDIAYKEDIDRVIGLIRDNMESYREQIPAIVEGPYVDGVTEMGDSGVTITMWASADQGKVNAIERDLRRITKRLLDENGIEIPFKQVTIHQG